MLSSGVVRGLNASSVARALCMGALVGILGGGCAQLAGLGEGTDLAGTTPTTTPVGVEPRGDVNVAITPTTLDYGSLPCGTSSPEKLISITNSGSLPASYEVQLPAGTAFRLNGDAKGTLAAKASKTIGVIADPRLAGESSADLVVTAGEALQPVRLTTKGTGPTFELTQTTIAFGEVRKESGGALVAVEVKNNGTDPLSVATFTSTDPNFEVEWTGRPTAFSVPPAGSGQFSVKLKPAASPDGAALKSTIKPTLTAFCGTAPSLIASGQRVTSEITVSPIDWGRQACGTTPEMRVVTISNYANMPATYTIDKGASPDYDVNDKSNGTVAAAPSSSTPATATIEVTPKRLAVTAPLPNATQQLGIVLTSPTPGASGRRNAALHVETRGAIVTLTPTLAFTADGSKNFTVDNTGNEDVFLTWGIQRSSQSWSGSGPPFVGGGSSATGKVTLSGGSAGDTATITPAQPFLARKPECKPMGSVSATR